MKFLQRLENINNRMKGKKLRFYTINQSINRVLYHELPFTIDTIYNKN